MRGTRGSCDTGIAHLTQQGSAGPAEERNGDGGGGDSGFFWVGEEWESGLAKEERLETDAQRG